MTRVNRQREKYLSRTSQILGIVPNKMRPKTMVHRQNIASIANAYNGLVWAPVTLRTAWVEAANLQEMIYRYAPNGQEARDAWALVAKTRESI
jgi:cellulose biosynthesis protein BcsQ